MSMWHNITLKLSEDVVFDDIAALNTELWNNTYMQELYRASENGDPNQDIIKIVAANVIPHTEVLILGIAEGYIQGYGNVTDSYGFWNREIFNIIAKHMTESKLVFVETREYDPADPAVFIVTPNNVECKSIDDLI